MVKDKMTANEFRDLIGSKKIVSTKKGLVSNNYDTVNDTVNEDVRVFTFYDLPKVSLNAWYASTHWKQRDKVKQQYKKLIPTLTNIHFPIEISFQFYFKSHPLDADNCVAMIKLCVDSLLDGVDGWDKFWIGGIRSYKGTENKVVVSIKNMT